MAKDELIDDHVSSKQVRKAVEALLAHELKKQEEKQETELLPGKEPNVWLNITVKKISPTKSLKPIKIPIAHPIVDPRTTGVCLITKDPQREYKDLLDKHGIKFISRVVGIEKLKGKFKPFEARRMLLKENGLFLADERVIPLLPKLLGSKWFEAKKQPLPVSLTRKDLKGELEQAISSTYMNQNKGTCTSIKVGLISQKSAQVVANIKMAIPTIVKHIKEGWSNVQSLHIKTNSSTSLPVWSCELGDGEGGRWDGLVVASDDGEEDESDDQNEGDEESGQEEDEDEPSSEEEPAKPPPPPQKKGKKRAPEEETEPEKSNKRTKSNTSEIASKKTAAPAPSKPTSGAKTSAASSAAKPISSPGTPKPSDSRPPKKSAAPAPSAAPPTSKKRSSSGEQKSTTSVVDKKPVPPAANEKPKPSEAEKKSKSEPVKKAKSAEKEKKSKPSQTPVPKDVAPVAEKTKTKSKPPPVENEPKSSETGKKVKSSGIEKKPKTSKSLKDTVLGKKPGKH